VKRQECVELWNVGVFRLFLSLLAVLEASAVFLAPVLGEEEYDGDGT